MKSGEDLAVFTFLFVMRGSETSHVNSIVVFLVPKLTIHLVCVTLLLFDQLQGLGVCMGHVERAAD